MPRFRFIPVSIKTRLNIWPFTSGTRSRLPEHYRTRWMQEKNHVPLPVHHIPKPLYKRDEFGQVVRRQEVNVPVVYPDEAYENLWAGEGFIQCFVLVKGKRGRPDMRVPKIWKPGVKNRALYSEILDRWMAVSVTTRTLDMIDDAFGFDNYILKTNEVDLNSRLGMTLKNEMMVTLARKSMYPNDPEKRDEIYEKYHEVVIPEEEAEWIGLTLREACKKQEAIEDAAKECTTVPLKKLYKAQLIQKLKDKKDLSGEGSGDNWLSVFNPFQKKTLQQRLS